MRISSLLVLVSLLSAPPALADRVRVVRGPWHEGHWIHDRHDGRLGWWWVVGGAWHFYERPVRTVIVEQPAPPPQVTVVTAAPPAPPVAVQPVLYYCRATGTYYPETMTCPGGWMTQVSAVPPSPIPASNAQP